MKNYIIAIGVVCLTGLTTIGLDAIFAAAHPMPPRRDCECIELRAIRRMLETSLSVVCDERGCQPAPEGTPNGGGME